jgi:hypothetical protein
MDSYLSVFVKDSNRLHDLEQRILKIKSGVETQNIAFEVEDLAREIGDANVESSDSKIVDIHLSSGTNDATVRARHFMNALEILYTRRSIWWRGIGRLMTGSSSIHTTLEEAVLTYIEDVAAGSLYTAAIQTRDAFNRLVATKPSWIYFPDDASPSVQKDRAWIYDVLSDSNLSHLHPDDKRPAVSRLARTELTNAHADAGDTLAYDAANARLTSNVLHAAAVASSNATDDFFYLASQSGAMSAFAIRSAVVNGDTSVQIDTTIDTLVVADSGGNVGGEGNVAHECGYCDANGANFQSVPLIENTVAVPDGKCAAIKVFITPPANQTFGASIDRRFLFTIFSVYADTIPAMIADTDVDVADTASPLHHMTQVLISYDNWRANNEANAVSFDTRLATEYANLVQGAQYSHSFLNIERMIAFRASAGEALTLSVFYRNKIYPSLMTLAYLARADARWLNGM